MKETIKLFNRICRVIDPEMFYAIRLYRNEIRMQGHVTAEKMSMCRKYKFNTDYTDTEFIYFTRHISNYKIIITLT